MPATDTYRERAATLAGGILKQHARDVDTSGRFPRESVSALGPELLGMCVPAEFGGDGLGLRGNDSAPVSLQGVGIADGDLITPQGEGAAAMLQVILPWFNIGSAAMSNGLCRAAVGATATHLQAGAFEHTGTALRDLP